MIRAIILDFDGVVIESVGLKTEVFKVMFEDQPDIAGPFVEYHLKNNGKSRFEKFEWLYKNVLKKPLAEEERIALGNKFSQLVFQKILNCPYVEGAIDFLKEFHARYPIYIASITPQKELEEIVKKRSLDIYFKGVIGTIGQKAELINQIFAKEKVRPKEVLFVGDTMEDYNAARQTGVNFVARLCQEKFSGLDVRRVKNLKEVGPILNET